MCEYSDELWRAGEAYGKRIGERRGAQREQSKFQRLILAMVQANETALLPRLGKDREFVRAMYRKYKI